MYPTRPSYVIHSSTKVDSAWVKNRPDMDMPFLPTILTLEISFQNNFYVNL